MNLKRLTHVVSSVVRSAGSSRPSVLRVFTSSTLRSDSQPKQINSRSLHTHAWDPMTASWLCDNEKPTQHFDLKDKDNTYNPRRGSVRQTT